MLSWIHELPTFIALLGGDRAIDEIKLASRKIMVPSEAVRSALTSRFRIDADRIQTVYNGQDPRTHGLDREALRLEVRRELGLPPDARIVLGCGTIDLRKGADLFVNVARRVLLDRSKDKRLTRNLVRLGRPLQRREPCGAGSCTTLESTAWTSGSGSSGPEARWLPTTWPPICWR